jgi:hypothetical protein
MIVSSEIQSQVPQADGRISVTERHTHADGAIQLYDYLAPEDFDLMAVANQRAANINAELARRDAQLLEANNFEAPITVRDFLALIPAADRIALRVLAETTPALQDGLKYLESGTLVYKVVAQQWLNGLATAGIMSQQLVDDIMAGWEANYA